MARVGVVVIGRNEGVGCASAWCRSIRLHSRSSMSTPGLPMAARALARSLGVEVVDLDLSIPFTAARARNAGFDRLRQICPEVERVQFVDGDCQVQPGWFEKAQAALDADPKVAAVCGRRRERHPEVSIYNRLCDIEWDTPIGDTLACGGDVLMREEVVRQVGGYDPNVIAAEDNEICIRIRQGGWKIRRIEAEMTLHDAAMTRFRQWWKRAVRAGFAYALGAAMHGSPPERHFTRERRRVITWGFAVPVILLGFAWPTYGLSLIGFVLYPLQIWRIYRRTRQRQKPAGDSLAFGISCMASKLPEFMGLCKFYLMRMRKQRARIIEYK